MRWRLVCGRLLCLCFLSVVVYNAHKEIHINIMNEQPDQQPAPQTQPTTFQPEVAQTMPPSQPVPADPTPSVAAPVSPSFQQQTYAQQPTAEPASAANVPENWPGAFGVYKFSKSAVRAVLVTLVVLYLLSFAVSFVLGMVFTDDISFVADILSFIISGLFSVAMIFVFLSGVRGQKIELGESLSKSVSLWLPMLGLTILAGLIVGLSLLLLIIPFFFVFPRLILATYFLVDQKLGIVASIKASWAATKGNVGKVYGIVGANIAFSLLFLTIIGIPFAIYFLVMYSAAVAILYEYIRNRQGAPVSPISAQQPVADYSAQNTTLS